jgi:hypothetical protein
LLERLRATGRLKERSRGTFYLKSRAFLHFHEDPAGVFADIRAVDGKDFERLPLSGPADWDDLIARAMARAG